jgi:hypothetical protein
MGDVQISQVLAEVDAQNSAPDIQITQLMAEVDAQNSAPPIIITQLLLEVDVFEYLPPTVPSDLTATATSTSNISLGWVDNSSDEIKFKIYRSLDGETYELLATINENITSHQDDTCSAETKYWYKVSALGEYLESDYTEVAYATTKAVAPSDLTATAFDTETINLSWTDNSNNETGFSIQRSEDNVTFADLDTVIADEESYSDTTCLPGTTYYYKVKATGSVIDSDYSDVASDKTPNLPTGGGGLTLQLTLRLL